jgi:NAD-dependent SIR2 family protein deacetylase
MNQNTIIFLGAGASKTEGAPLQNELFNDYFKIANNKKIQEERDRELITFFYSMFNIDIDLGNTDSIVFPTFEEALGLTDLAILRKESFKDFEIENRASNSGRLRFISQYLVFLMADVLEKKLKDSNKYHTKLVNNLLDARVLKETAFISTNYDILIDNAITELIDLNIELDYGIDFINFDRLNDWKRPDLNKSVNLFKIHGSLNWLYCPTCNNIEITPKEKGVVTRLISHFEDATCNQCDSVYLPIIVPPTYYKDLNNVFLSTIWNKAENVLRKVDHVIICGYSFPDADFHIKYLLKRAQVNRKNSLKFTVINNYEGKPKSNIEDEKYRFTRFLGPNINYTDLSFQDFTEDPLQIIKP